jgi:ankyrin repeat protein
MNIMYYALALLLVCNQAHLHTMHNNQNNDPVAIFSRYHYAELIEYAKKEEKSEKEKIQKTIQLLIDTNVDINQGIDEWGRTVLIWAAAEGHKDLVTILLEQQQINVDKADDLGFTPLHRAASKGHGDVVDLLLSKDARIDLKSKRGTTPLHEAASNGHVGVLESLLKKDKEHHITLDLADNNSTTPLHKAVWEGHDSVVTMLIKEGANIVVDNKDCSTLLHRAAREGHLDATNLLFTKGFDPNMPNNLGDRPLHCAARNGHRTIVELLLNKGALLTTNNEGNTPLHEAAHHGHCTVVQLFLNNHNNNDLINAKNRWGNTPLYEAAKEGHYPMVELLLNKGALLTADTFENTPSYVATHYTFGDTPLHVAASKGHYEVVKLILNTTDCNVSTSDKFGRTLLHNAIRHGWLDIAEQLLKKNTLLVNVSDHHGNTPLHEAAQRSCEIVELLLNNNATINQNDYVPKIVNQQILPEQTVVSGDSPLHLAAAQGKLNIVTLLIERGMNINKVNRRGKTPLYRAIEGGHTDVVKALLEKHTPAVFDELQHGRGLEAVHSAASHGHINVIEILLEHIPLDLTDEHGWTLLHRAVQGGNKSMTKYLIDRGAQINKPDNVGNTPLVEAIRCSHLDGCYDNKSRDNKITAVTRVVKYLLKNNADINFPNKGSSTPLHIAIGCGDSATSIAELLLDKGANPNSKDNQGHTPLDHAFYYKGCETLATLLINYIYKLKGQSLTSPKDTSEIPPSSSSASIQNHTLAELPESCPITKQGTPVDSLSLNKLEPYCHKTFKELIEHKHQWGIAYLLAQVQTDKEKYAVDGASFIQSRSKHNQVNTLPVTDEYYYCIYPATSCFDFLCSRRQDLTPQSEHASFLSAFMHAHEQSSATTKNLLKKMITDYKNTIIPERYLAAWYYMKKVDEENCLRRCTS